MSVPTITIPVESKVRELDEKLALAARLAAGGRQVIVGPDASLDGYAFERGTDIYFLNNASQSASRSKLFPVLAARGTRILLLDMEGANQSDSPAVRARFDKDLVPHIYRYLAWGRSPARAVTSSGITPDKIVITGLPRFDTLRAPYDAIHDDSRRRLREQHGRFLLVNTNHTRANPFAAHVVRELTSDPAVVEHQRAMITAYADAIPAILARYEDINVVLRPHPGENIDTYKRMFAGNPRVRVVFEGSAQPWIKEALAVIHNTCLTGVEAALAGTPVCAFTPTSWQQDDFTIANTVSTKALDVPALVAFVGACLAGTPPTSELERPEVRKALQNVIENIDSLAVDAVDAVVARLCADGGARHERVGLRAHGRRAAFAVLGKKGVRWVRRIRHARDPSRLNYSLHKMSGISRAEVESRLALLERSVSLPRLKVRPIAGFENTFRITRA